MYQAVLITNYQDH